MDAAVAAWMQVGKAQRAVPAHVAQEYCSWERSFFPCPAFNKPISQRVLTFHNSETARNDSWFPLTSSNTGLGFDFGVIRGSFNSTASQRGQASRFGRRHAAFDLAAITHLDKVRTADRTLSREHLNPSALSRGLAM